MTGGALWGTRECAACLGVRPQTWSTYVSRGLAPRSIARGQWDPDEVEAWARPRVPAADPDIPAGTYGAADGHGRYGILDTAEDGRLICHECGRGVWHLTSHLHTAHQLHPTDYRQAHGLSRTVPLVATPVLEHLSEEWAEHSHQHLANLDATRDPARATEASRGHAAKSPHTRAQMRHPRGRDLTATEVQLLDTAPDLATWARIARRLTDDGVSTTSISTATGVLRTTVYARITRLAPRT